MSKRKLVGLFLLSGIIGTIACTKNTLNLPEPAQSIEGVYEAQNNQTPFPIKGQTLQLTVKRLSSDSVSVVVKSIINGQPGDSLSYRSAFVDQILSQYEGCVIYRVYLTAQQDIDLSNQKEFNQLNMTCNEKNVFQYLYKPAGNQSYRAVSFKKL